MENQFTAIQRISLSFCYHNIDIENAGTPPLKGCIPRKALTIQGFEGPFVVESALLKAIV